MSESVPIVNIAKLDDQGFAKSTRTGPGATRKRSKRERTRRDSELTKLVGPPRESPALVFLTY